MTDRKRELWEKDKNAIQRFKVNASLWFMKFQRQTHGMGLIFMIMVAFMLIFMIYNLAITMIEQEERMKVREEMECKRVGGCYNDI